MNYSAASCGEFDPLVLRNFSVIGLKFLSFMVIFVLHYQYRLNVTLDELDEDIERIKMRVIPQLGGVGEDTMRLIDGIARFVNLCGIEAPVSDEIIVKTVLLLSAKIIPVLLAESIPVRRLLRDEIEKTFGDIRVSA